MSHPSKAKYRAPAGWEESLERLGANILLARKRRELREIDVAELSGISRFTLRRIEEGNAGTSMGAYVAVLRVLGFHRDLYKLAAPEGDPYDGMPIEIARRIRRSYPPPDMLTWEWGETERGRKEIREMRREIADRLKTALRIRREMEARQAGAWQEALDALLAKETPAQL